MTHHKNADAVQTLSEDTLTTVTGGWWRGQEWNGGWNGSSGGTSTSTTPTPATNTSTWGGWNGRGWGS